MSNRYEREIEEILRQAGELGTGGRSRAGSRGLLRLAWLYVAGAIGGKTWSLSPGRVMLAGVLLLLSALIVGSAAPGGLVPLLGWGGLILLIVGYAMFFIRPQPVEKRWRGQPIDDRGQSWWDRLRRKMG